MQGSCKNLDSKIPIENIVKSPIEKFYFSEFCNGTSGLSCGSVLAECF